MNALATAEAASGDRERGPLGAARKTALKPN
jgi:hypothetical protein